MPRTLLSSQDTRFGVIPPSLPEFTIDGTVYRWLGSLDALFESVERGVHLGQVREIGGRLFTAVSVSWRWFARPVVTWGLATEFASSELVRRVRSEVFARGDSAA